MKLLEVRLTGRNHSEEINFLKGTIMELQEQIDRNNELLANSTPETNGIIGITEEQKKLEATL